jgi:hypothetical protein
MKFAPYQAETVFVVSTCHTGISHELHIYSEYGNVVGKVCIGDEPEDFLVDVLRYGYEPVIDWVADNWRGFHSDKADVKSILDVPALTLKYDEE